jgi:hypothetical protein
MGCKCEECRRCAPFLSAQRRQLYYMYYIDLIYTIYIIFYNMCEIQVRLVRDKQGMQQHENEN